MKCALREVHESCSRYRTVHGRFANLLFHVQHVPRCVERTSQCHPPSPIAFITVPLWPTSDDFVRLLPTTSTFVWRGSSVISSPE